MTEYNYITSSCVPDDHPISEFNDFWYHGDTDVLWRKWSDFQPMKMSAILPWIMVLDCLSENQYQYRLCGSGCEGVFRTSLTGKLFGEGIKPEFYKASLLEFANVKKGLGPVFMWGYVPIEGREFIKVYRAVYGFSTHESEIDRILVIVAPVDGSRSSFDV